MAGSPTGSPASRSAARSAPGSGGGANRHIVWNAGADWNGNWVPACRVRVTAHDGTTPPAPPGMAYIPPGLFQMGDSFPEGSTDERPVHTVQLAGFFIDKTEVPKALWEQVKAWGNANGYSISGGSWKGDNHPVHSVNWYSVVRWCNARSQREGLTPCYYTDAGHTTIYKTGDVGVQNTWVDWDANGYRLPTEAEWEKAARGGRTGQRFPHGNTISHSDANFYNGGGETYQTGTTGYHPTYNIGSQPYTASVASFAANDYGLFDMAGNLWEWTWDWYGSGYYGSPESLDNPAGPTAGSRRVLRGGGWGNDAAAAAPTGTTTVPATRTTTTGSALSAGRSRHPRSSSTCSRQAQPERSRAWG